jgi:hypothetical protein
MNYYLMNKNDKLLEFETSKGLSDTRISEIRSLDKRRPPGFININTWIAQRNYAKHKDHLKGWLKVWGIDTVDGFLNVTHCLGINDCLWVKPVDSTFTWEDVNLYRNDFDDITAKTAFETGLHGLQLSSTSPEFTTEGSFPKFWKREKEDIFLYKAGLSGAANVGLEPYSEYMASHIAKNLEKYLSVTTNVTYDLKTYKGKLVSVCSLFTDEKTGFVPFSRLIDRNIAYSLEDVIKTCTDMGYERQCKEMFLIDSVVFNQDRHLGNFGFLFDNETFEITGFAPLFDFNISMLCNAMKEDLEDFETYQEKYLLGHKLGGTFGKIGNFLAKDLGVTLPKRIGIPLHELYNLPQDRMERLSEVFEKNYRQISGKGITNVIEEIPQERQ